VQQARDQRLIGQALRERLILNRLEVLARQNGCSAEDPPKRGLAGSSVPSPLALAIGGGLPLAALDGFVCSSSTNGAGYTYSSRWTTKMRWPAYRSGFGCSRHTRENALRIWSR
jgi:hypothetical protein